MAFSAAFRRLLALPLVITALAAGTATATAKPAKAGPFQRYVSLGDSFVSGAYIPHPRPESRGCLRTTGNYPTVLATRLGVQDFADASCIGAFTHHMTTRQDEPSWDIDNPPQFDRLTPDTDLVTITTGGINIGFMQLAIDCALASFGEPLGTPCKKKHTVDGVEQIAKRIEAAAPKVNDVLAELKRRAPKAKVVMVGYPRLVPASIGCFPTVPIAFGDVEYLDGLQRKLNSTLAAQAAANGVPFVDVYKASEGRDACQAPNVRWIEGVIPSSPTAPAHPNAAGMKAVADLVHKAVLAKTKD
ncbi:SGNH/GDSL hydrolase family protein [Allokutzneria sp. A3M-2-11 16]|uniref:SGNH/GDSL hydrolase family protein n=1 Tax=Allokutzneria sp. A3M-2-11 16 TaxID=2962043 RepID=UPI0020B7BB4B|nr:SGNH/GDSL hydrolase family protein [Allokutzneria sp. A3M-2-11 16]MCP3798313.1 SGNH/GDSL hydrolase family protein [Allokutzneria sp. A3M-2-11 16]